MILHAEMRKNLKRKSGRRWVADGRTGEMNLNFIGFFGRCTVRSKVKEMLTTLLNEYFESKSIAEMRLDECFDLALKEDINDYYKKILQTSRDMFYSMCNINRNSDNTIEMMNNFKPESKKHSVHRFYYDGCAVLFNPQRICFFYQTNNKELKCNNPKLNSAFDDFYNALLDVELNYKAPIKKLKNLGKNGYLDYDGTTFNLSRFIKFMNPKEDVELGLYVKPSGAKFLMLNQPDRWMAIVTSYRNDEDEAFTFKIEEIADET